MNALSSWPPNSAMPLTINPNPGSYFGLPLPEQVAPCLFNNHVHPDQGQNAGNVANYNMNPAAQPVAPAASQAPPPTPEPPADKKTDKKEESEKDFKPLINHSKLTPDLVKEINQGLENSEETVRIDAARKLVDAIWGDREVLNKQPEGAYAEQLILKVLRDPKSVVRQSVITLMEGGTLTEVTPAIIKELQKRKKDGGLYNFEPQAIGSALRRIEQAKQEKVAAAQQAQMEAQQKALEEAQAAQMAALQPPMQNPGSMALGANGMPPNMMPYPTPPGGYPPMMAMPPMGMPPGYPGFQPNYMSPGPGMMPPGQRLNVTSPAQGGMAA